MRQRERGGGAGRLGRERTREDGPAESVLAAEKEKEEESWAGFWAGLERKKEEEKVFHFLKDPNTFSLNSNSRIQIQVEQQAIKLCKRKMNATQEEPLYLF